MKTTYQLLDRATNNWVIDTFLTLEEAEETLKQNEKEDKINWTFVENYYEIKKITE